MDEADAGSTVEASVTLALEPEAAFDVFVDELATALTGAGLTFEPEAKGRIVEDGREVGRVTAWVPGERIALAWRPADWAPEDVAAIEVRLERREAATRVVLELHGLGRLLGDEDELAGWFAGAMAAPLLRAASPRAFGDWVTDRRARRPSGAQARAYYRDPLYHYPNFRAILDELALRPADLLLEVGCGGGAFLADALASGCRAAAVDHSPEMVELARATNRAAVAEGRLDVRLAGADRLPFADAAFTCAVMTGVLGFLPDPIGSLQEIRRVLGPGGRLVALGSDPEMRGTPAAPEPMASRLHFYGSDELERLGRAAGFDTVAVVRRDLAPYAREAGVPEVHLPLFAGPGARFLLARRT